MDFIRLTSAEGPVTVARSAIRVTAPLRGGGTRIGFHDATLLDVTDAPDVVADLLVPVKVKQEEEEPKQGPKGATK